MSFRERLQAASERNGSLLCVGLDPDPARLPSHLGPADDARTVVAFNRAIIEATADLVCAYKPNLGFYLAYGPAGVEALIETRRLIPPEIPVILDAKVGDLGNTSIAYARAYFEAWDFDAVTVHPYMGEDSLEPFLSRADRAVFVLVKTSNPGSGDLQDLLVTDDGATEPLYLRVAARSPLAGALWHLRARRRRHLPPATGRSPRAVPGPPNPRAGCRRPGWRPDCNRPGGARREWRWHPHQRRARRDLRRLRSRLRRGLPPGRHGPPRRDQSGTPALGALAVHCHGARRRHRRMCVCRKRPATRRWSVGWGGQRSASRAAGRRCSASPARGARPSAPRR